jgi:hypothetical protein
MMPAAGSPPPSTTVLGDFYATLIVRRPAHLILCVSARTLLPVVVPAAPLSGFAPRFRSAVMNMLRSLGIAEPAVVTEGHEMNELCVARTESRQILGSMNDFQRMLPHHLDQGESLLDASLKLAEAPCGPIGMASPARATRELLRLAQT